MVQGKLEVSEQGQRGRPEHDLTDIIPWPVASTSLKGHFQYLILSNSKCQPEPEPEPEPEP